MTSPDNKPDNMAELAFEVGKHLYRLGFEPMEAEEDLTERGQAIVKGGSKTSVPYDLFVREDRSETKCVVVLTAHLNVDKYDPQEHQPLIEDPANYAVVMFQEDKDHTVGVVYTLPFNEFRQNMSGHLLSFFDTLPRTAHNPSTDQTPLRQRLN